MKIRVLFHHLDDDPDWMPNVVLCMDEYTLENCGEEIWDEDVAAMLPKHGPGSTREAWIEVPDSAVTKLFETPVMSGKMVHEQEQG